ncbi:zinc metalloprotease [Actinomadura flavalba]|uniref:zinc metalloprotease n=1 Tax=Actinomadura flavalba TaxID=1120938 RepID=UPI00036361F3|nr:zinc metalloprotease [Actinomadura flavalba]
MAVTFCAVPAASGVQPRTEPDPCAPAAARVAGGPASALFDRLGRDRSDLEPDEVVRLLDDLRAALRDRYGTDDETRLDGRLRRAAPITVPVRFHVLHSGADGRLTRAEVDRQIATLTTAYRSTDVTFRLDSVDYTDNDAWYRDPERYERTLKRRLRQGGAETLNLYTAAVGADVLGFSSFPQQYRQDPVLDGVVVDHRSLPGGAYQNFDLGYTAVHETGHWLGLFHTFENGCTAPGDGIDDTPYEAGPAQGCPEGRDTCPQPGADPVHNFMDYSHDACMREFTAGQGLRVRAAWAAYRAPAAEGRRTTLAAVAAHSVVPSR